MAARILLPELRAWTALETAQPPEEVATYVGKGLGILFRNDTEGLFEEFNAQVGAFLHHVIGIYRPDDEYGNLMPTLYLDLYSRFNPAFLGLSRSDFEIVRHSVSEFLAALLRKQTGLLFVPSSSLDGDSQDASGPGSLDSSVIPRFQADLIVNTRLPLDQVCTRTGTALDLSFGPVHMADRPHYQGQPWYARAASVLGHNATVFAARSPHHTPLPRPIVFALRSVLDLTDLKLDPSFYDTVNYTISDFLAVWLREETDLPFEAVRT